MYKNYIKRVLDVFCASAALVLLLPVFLILSVCGAIMLRGNPFFLQPRPGKNEVIFKMIKFRSMTNCTDDSGKLLPDEQRITRYGRFLRNTSLDELPELVNILIGDMSVVGPRPQLVRDMVFMTAEQRKRHTVRPGLTGLAQVSGRNALVWDKKLEIDLEYLSHITFFGDLSIIFRTVKLILFGGGSNGETDLTDDYGDFLLKRNCITASEYDDRQAEAEELLGV